MVGKFTRLRVRRKVRARKKQVVGISLSANHQLDRHIFRRWHNLKYAARFAFTWMGLIAILIVALSFQLKALGRYYLVPTPVPGGIYTEGMVGSFNNANPVYAVSDVDTSISKLVFSSLLTYDKNNNLSGDLAKSWTIDSRGLNYTVKLRDNIKWHDGVALTADDVVFTYQTIQNPDTKSPYLSSWTNIKVSKIDDKTIKFVLPNAYSPFLHSLTVGIIPKHILSKVSAVELRSDAFNNKRPIGSGPFEFKEVDIDSSNNSEVNAAVQLTAFKDYHLGRPKLDGITFTTFRDESALKVANEKHKIITASGLNTSDSELPGDHETYSFSLMSANMIFLKATSPTLESLNVRKALAYATDVPALTAKIGYPAVPVREPILKSQVGYNKELQQLTYDKKQAAALLDEAGWAVHGKEQYRSRNGKPLLLKLTYQNSADFSRIAQALQKQWAQVGVNLSIEVTPDNQVRQRILDSHDYDVLLYGINIGADPDVYAYWHSSQIDKKSLIHLNLSEYKSTVADSALEAGRSRQDDAVRAVKYKPFLAAWQKDVPAIGLYQPRYLYVYSHQHVYGINNKYINTPSDRFDNVHEWMIKTASESKS